MFGDGSLTFHEFVTREPLPLATIQEAVLDFLRGRDDAVLFGAQAVTGKTSSPGPLSPKRKTGRSALPIVSPSKYWPSGERRPFL